MPTDQDLPGVWQLETFTVDEEVLAVEVDVNAASVPYVEIGDVLSGDFGCNGFGQDHEAPFEFSDGVLMPDDVISEMAACAPETLMEVETAFRDMLLANVEIDVDIVGDTMWWTAGGAPQISFGPLDCSPDPVERERVPAEGSDLDSFASEGERLTMALANVDSVDQPDPDSLVWIGYDADGEAVAGVGFDDVTPHTFSIYTCP